ncbi:MAG: hypothetical protein U1F83_04545 [Verrucomicrobiota bacterium]
MLTKSLPVICLAAIVIAAGCNRSKPGTQGHRIDSGQWALDFPTNVTAYHVKGAATNVVAEIQTGRVLTSF